MEGFEAACITKHYSARLASLTLKLCKRTHLVVGTKIRSVQVCCEYISQTACKRMEHVTIYAPFILHSTGDGEIFSVHISGSRPSDQLSDPGLENP